MAATKTQGAYLTGFIVAFTLTGLGCAHLGTAIGKILLIVGGLGMAQVLLAFRGLRHSEAVRPALVEGRAVSVSAPR